MPAQVVVVYWRVEVTHTASSSHTVFVVGAGVSADMGYPLTRDLFFLLWPRLDSRFQERLGEVVNFHHPAWDQRSETLPDIEEFLTELAANEDLLPTMAPHGGFGPPQLREVKKLLLMAVARWFHEIYAGGKPSSQQTVKTQLLRKILDSENPVVISFNWDYELDAGILGAHPNLRRVVLDGYGLNGGLLSDPCILKPHGSLNWYLEPLGRHLKVDRTALLWEEPKRKDQPKRDAVYCFLRWREPRTKHDREYIPWIVPPTHMKDFRHPMLGLVWRRCSDAIGTANRIFFLGYSLPLADWHSRYIFRCGFHRPQGRPPEVIIVNPDNAAFRRIESVCGKRCTWVPKTVAQWLEADNK